MERTGQLKKSKILQSASQVIVVVVVGQSRSLGFVVAADAAVVVVVSDQPIVVAAVGRVRIASINSRVIPGSTFDSILYGFN